MGKTLKRERKKADAASSRLSKDISKRRTRKGPTSSLNLANQVSAAFADKNWDAAVQALEAMRRAGEMPKLGSTQRWVRLADMVGNPQQVARLLSAILRAVPGGGPIAHTDDTSRPTNKCGNGGIRHYPPWSPPLTSQQQAWQISQGATFVHSPKPAAASSATLAGNSNLAAAPDLEVSLASMASATAPQNPAQTPAAVAAAGAEAAAVPLGPLAAAARATTSALSPAQAPCFSLVEQDISTQPVKRPPNFKELKVYALAPGAIRFGPDPAAVRHDVPFVPGAFVMAGLLSPDECRQIIAATEAIGYSWDVDYTFNPSSPASAAALDPALEAGQQGDGGQGMLEDSEDGFAHDEEQPKGGEGLQSVTEGAGSDGWDLREVDTEQGQQGGREHLSEGALDKKYGPEGLMREGNQQGGGDDLRHGGGGPLDHKLEGQQGGGEQEATQDGREFHEKNEHPCVNEGGQQGHGQQADHDGEEQHQSTVRGEHVGQKRGLEEALQGGEQLTGPDNDKKRKKKQKKKKKHRQQGQGQILGQQQQGKQGQETWQGGQPQGQQHPLLSAARTAAGGDRAAGCVLLADDSLLGPIVRRASVLLPQVLGGGELAGLNCRLRCYRYDAGNVYRPHVDGAWPGSGVKNGKMVHDAYGDRWSRLTFLVYLNDDFEGGATTFFTPAADSPSALQARGVCPRTGNVLCFTHGDTASALVHEGSAVKSGKKYVIRTDVLYKLATEKHKQCS